MKIKTADQLKKDDSIARQMRQKAIEQSAQWLMASIESSNANGRNRVCFNVQSVAYDVDGNLCPAWEKRAYYVFRCYEIEKDVMEIFAKAGYTFEQTPPSFGVRQDTIDICW